MDDVKDVLQIRVFTADESLKILGELLGNKSSRHMIKALADDEMYANEIAKKLGIRPNLVAHHLARMESIGLLEITYKKIIRKGEEHKHFRIPKGMLVFPKLHEEDISDGFVKKMLQKGIKFAVIGIASLLPLLAVQAFEAVGHAGADYDLDPFSMETVIAGMGIAIVGLIVERIHASRRRSSRMPC